MRALISVSDKTGVVDFARGLRALGWEVIATGGTMKLLADSGVEVINISDVTGFPEICDGRVKTLHPNVHGGLLARRDDPEHLKALKEMDFPLFYAGHDPRTSKGRAEINECQIPVIMYGVTINPGDIIFGDIDGVAVIPKDIADEVIEKAFETIKSEDQVRESLRQGATMEAVYAKHGTI